MPDWTPPRRPDGEVAFNQISPLRILYELDGEPIIFTTSVGLRSLLCYKISNRENRSKYIASPTSELIIQKVVSGVFSLREAVVQPWQWLVEVNEDDFSVCRSWTIDGNTIPDGILPKQGVPLYYRHRKDTQPYLSIKYSGGQVAGGLIPLSVIKSAVDGVYASLVGMFSAAAQQAARGISEGKIRRALEIPTRQMVHASLMIAIEKPVINVESFERQFDPNLVDQSIETARDRFLSSAHIIAGTVSNISNIKKVAPDHIDALEIISKIVPAQNSFFDAIEIGGQQPGSINEPAIIRSRHSRLLRETYYEARGTPRSFDGEVFLINGGSHQFTMTAHTRNITCVATNETHNDAIDNLKKGDRVTVRGTYYTRQQRDLLYIQTMRKEGGLTRG
jgi:hypothetical protein